MRPGNRLCRAWLASLALATAAAPAVAAQSDADRIRELEAKTAALIEELAALRAEMSDGAPSQQLETLRIDVERANETARSARQAAEE